MLLRVFSAAVSAGLAAGQSSVAMVGESIWSPVVARVSLQHNDMTPSKLQEAGKHQMLSSQGLLVLAILKG